MLTVSFKAMGCRMAAFLDRDTIAAARALQQVPAWFEEWEQSLSRFRPDSELTRLNASAGRPFAASETLWAVTQAAVQAAQTSGGLVVPTVLGALERAGYDRSFEQLARGAQRSQAAVASTGEWQQINYDEARHEITLPPGQKLDLGGVAKGWAAQLAAERLSMYGPALVDAGGDLAASGPTDSGPWTIDIADPLEMQDNLGTLTLGRGGVATSGIDYRRWLRNGAWQHHIIDPRSELPADTDLLSVTVAAPNALQAETAAKTALILGSRAGLNWLEQQPGLAALLVCQDGQLLPSSALDPTLWRENVL